MNGCGLVGRGPRRARVQQVNVRIGLPAVSGQLHPWILIGFWGFFHGFFISPLNVAEQPQYSFPVSGGSYAQAGQGVVVQVAEVSGQ